MAAVDLDTHKSGGTKKENIHPHWNQVRRTRTVYVCDNIFTWQVLQPSLETLWAPLQTFAITNSHNSAPDLSSILCCELWPLISSIWIPHLFVSNMTATAHRLPLLSHRLLLSSHWSGGTAHASHCTTTELWRPGREINLLMIEIVMSFFQTEPFQCNGGLNLVLITDLVVTKLGIWYWCRTCFSRYYYEIYL